MFDQLVPPHIILPKESNKQLFFLDNFKGRRHSIPFNIHKHTGEGLPNNEFKINYILNEQGFRCKNFKNDADLVTLGCSFTFGWGLEKEHMWSNLLSEKINMKVANLSFVGDSIQNQILNFLNYLQYYKKPKVLVALFPLNRISFPEGTWYKDKLKTKQIKSFQLNKTVEKYSKFPHSPENVLSSYDAVFHTHLMIKFLEEYCESNNIKFIWNVWDDYYLNHFFVKKFKSKQEVLKECYQYISSNQIEDAISIDEEYFYKYYRNYCQLEINLWNFENNKDLYDNEEINCHQDLSNNILFHRAADREYGLNKAHWGIHRNIHIAEDFYKFYKETNDNN